MTIEQHMKNAEFIVNLLENRFNFFGLRFGIDPIIGLFPVIGDFLPFVLSLYFIYIGFLAKMPTSKLVKMGLYSFLDWLLGTVPVIGDIIDFFYHGHLKNYEVLKVYLDKQ